MSSSCSNINHTTLSSGIHSPHLIVSWSDLLPSGGASTFPNQASGSNRHPTSSHAHHPSVVTVHPTLGNQAIGVLTTDQNAVPSTSREMPCTDLQCLLRTHLPLPKDPSASGITSVNEANSVFSAPPTTESGQSDLGNKIKVVVWPRTERTTKGLWRHRRLC